MTSCGPLVSQICFSQICCLPESSLKYSCCHSLFSIDVHGRLRQLTSCTILKRTLMNTHSACLGKHVKHVPSLKFLWAEPGRNTPSIPALVRTEYNELRGQHAAKSPTTSARPNPQPFTFSSVVSTNRVRCSVRLATC